MTETEYVNIEQKRTLSLGDKPYQKMSKSLRKKQKNGKTSLELLDNLQPQLGALALFGLDLERADSQLGWNWQDVGELISECNDPARPPVRGCNKKFIHWKLRRTVENIYFRIFTFLLIILDICLVITESIICPSNPVSTIIRNVDLAISVYFLVEVFLRIVALTPPVFFSKKSWYNIIDFIVVILAFGATIAASVIVDNLSDKEKKELCETKWNTFSKLVVIVRSIRILRFVRLCRIYFEHRRLVRGVRQRICENKRRFQVDGYDLDLTYILTNIIAMSFPSIGTKALYRNNIDKVAKFFEEKYSDTENIDYMIYNLCSEMEYDHRKFHGNVKRFRIDDHNVPSLEMMFDLTDSVREWLGGDRERERVVALHCKGGKGRTGTMICAVLIDMGLFKDATDSLQYFGQRRTDLNVSKQFQGVETYSQIRYVHYFQSLKIQKIREIPSVPLTVRSVNISGLQKVGKGDGSDFWLKIITEGKEVCHASFADQESFTSNYDEKRDLLSMTFTSPPRIVRDTKFMFFCHTKGVPLGYDDCAFFCWLHTYFIKNDRELLTREKLDNPHKEKTWAVWRENFSVELIFNKVLQ